MKIVIAVLAVMPLLAHAAPAAARDVSRPPLINRPQPNPPCGDYYDDCGQKLPRNLYLGDLRTKTSGLSAAIADGKMDKAGESLNGLFAGAGSKAKGSETSAVPMPDWAVEPRTDMGLSKFQFAPRGNAMRPLIERLNENKEREFKITPVGAEEEAVKEVVRIIVKDVVVPVVKETTNKIDKAIDEKLTKPDVGRAIDQYGGCRVQGTCKK